MEIKTISADGMAFLEAEEGCILHPYLDSVNIPTIGFGNTFYRSGARVKMTDPKITRKEAVELFRYILKYFETSVWSITRDDINQNQFNALISFAYNVGVEGFKNSTLLRLINRDRYDPRITSAFEMWRNAGAKKGILLKRRQREAALYFNLKKGSDE